MSKKKLAHSAGITADRDVSLSDISGRVAVGEHIYQVSLIYNDYRSSLEKGKNEDIPERIREQLNFHLSQIKEAESQGTELSTDAYYALALSAYWKRDFTNAEIYLIKAAERDLSNFQVRNLLCTIYHTKAAESFRLGRHEDAINYARRTKSYFPYKSIAESLMLMGYFYNQMYTAKKEREYLEKGKERFEMVLTLDCSDTSLIAGALNGLAVYYRNIGNIDMSISKYLEAIKLLPKYAGAHYGLAGMYEVKMRGSGSDEWRLKAIEEWKKFIVSAENDPAYSKKDIDVIEKWIQHLQQM